LRRLAFQVSRAARSGKDAEAIHDLRVAVRRLSRCLRVFAEFYPGDAWKKMRKETQAADAVGGPGARPGYRPGFDRRGGRGAAQRVRSPAGGGTETGCADLQLETRRWERTGFSRKWRGALEL